MPLPALERAEKLLGLAHQFLDRSASPALPGLAEAHLAKPLSQLSALLASMGPFSDWHSAAKCVLNAQLQLSGTMLQRCKVRALHLQTSLLAHSRRTPKLWLCREPELDMHLLPYFRYLPLAATPCCYWS